jgi:hypothetical protein
MAELRQLKIWAASALVAAFKARCASEGASMSSALSSHMESCVDPRARVCREASVRPIATRGERRQEVRRITARLAEILEREERYRDAIPENLQGGTAYEAAGESVDLLSQTIDLLHEAY